MSTIENSPLTDGERDLFDRLADECEDDETARVFELVAQSSESADSEDPEDSEVRKS